MKYTEIFGWFPESTAEALRSLIKGYEIKDVIEIGAFLGKSTAFFASQVWEVTSIDPFKMWKEGKENGDARAHGGEDFYDKFVENTKEYTNIVALRLPSVTADYCWSRNIKSDLVYIDGAHDYDSVKFDIHAFTPRANKIVCGDDYDENWPGVKQAVDEAFGDKVQLVGNFWYVIL